MSRQKSLNVCSACELRNSLWMHACVTSKVMKNILEFTKDWQKHFFRLIPINLNVQTTSKC